MVTIAQAADRLGVTPRTIGSWVMDVDDNLWQLDKNGWNGDTSWASLLERYGPVRLVTLGDPIGGESDD